MLIGWTVRWANIDDADPAMVGKPLLICMLDYKVRFD